jgi:hypothetical protein
MCSTGIPNFDGQTWVAFADLCGTKAFLKQGIDVAREALNAFYKTAYWLHDEDATISTLVVSDCAISWLNHGHEDKLQLLLRRLGEFQRQMIRGGVGCDAPGRGYLLQTSLAWGQFQYERRTERIGMRKDFTLGEAYMKAYLKNDKVPKGGICICDSQSQDDQRDRGIQGGTAGLVECPGDFSHEYIWWSDDPHGQQDARKCIEEKQFQPLIDFYRNGISR